MPNQSQRAFEQQPETASHRRSILMRSAVAASVLLVAALLLVAATAYAACSTNSYSVTNSAPPPTANWTDTTGAVWNIPGGFPGCAFGDTASNTNISPTMLVINTPIPNTLAGLTLNCSGCSIDIQSGGSLALSGNGTIGSGASITVEPGGSFTVANLGALTIASGGSLTVNGGFVDVQTGGQLTINGSTTVTNNGTLQLSGGSIASNNTFTINSNGSLALSAGTITGTSAVDNNGTVTMNGTSVVVSAPFNNHSTGSVTVNLGFLSLGGGGLGDGPFLIASSGTLDFPSGSYTTTPNGTVSGEGTMSVSGATVTIGAVTEPEGLTLSAGTLTGTGFLDVTNTFNWTGGTLSGSGTSQIAGSAVANITGTAPMTLDGKVLNNYGYTNYTAANALLLTNGATLSNYGTFDIQNDAGFASSGGNTINNQPNGIFMKSGGTGTSTIAPAFNNNASLTVYSGVLDFEGGGTQNGYFLAAFSSTGLTFGGTHTFNTGATVSGDGVVTFAPGGATFGGFYSVNGKTVLAGGTLNMNVNGSTTDFALDMGTLDVASNMTFSMTGTGTWSCCQIGGSGTFRVTSSGVLTIDAANSSTSLNAATLQNDGRIDYTAAAPRDFELGNGATIVNNGTFDVQTDQPITVNTFMVSGRLRPAPHGVISATNRFKNFGTFLKSAGTGTTNVDPVFTNQGPLFAQSGTLFFTSTFTQSTGGATTLGPGNLQNTAALSLLGGTLDGAGTITGDVQNTGATVTPGSSTTTGLIHITGTYTQGSGANLDVKLASASSFDQVTTGGTATLDGTFTATLYNGFTPSNGAVFPVLTFASRSGDFAVKNLPTFSGTHGSFTASYTPTELDLTAVVTPASWDLDLTGGMTGPTSVNAGSPLSYTVTIKNNGPDPTGGTITLVDTLPAGVTGASGSGSGWSCGAPSGGTITCTTGAVVNNGGSLPALTFNMTAPAQGASVSNSATVSSSSDSNAANNSTSAGTTVVAQADLQITKTGPNGVTAGQNVVYTITVTNNGPSDAVSVTVTDPQPANLTFVSNSGNCTSNYPCALGTLTPGQTATITSTYSTSPTFSGNVTNTATVGSVTSDPDNSNNSSSKTTNVGAQADLSITKTGPASTSPGQNVIYTVTVNNVGPSPATNVVVTDPTPVGLAFLSNTGACTTAYPCSLGTLPAGQTKTITSTYTVPSSYSGATVSNTASVSATENDPSAANNTSTATTTVVQQTDLSITKSGPAAASPGGNIVYTITVSNLGPSGAANVTVSDPTPPGLTFVSTSGACTSTFPCNVGTVNAGQSATITATFSIPSNYSSANVSNTASVSSSAIDPNASNDSSTVVTPVVAQADLAITKTGPATINAGQNITYTVTATNNGPLSAANVFINDATPPGLTFVSNSGACSGAYPCSIGTLAAGQSVTITSTYSIPSGFSGSTISNTATVSSSTNDLITANNSATAVTTFSSTPAADLAVHKSGPTIANPGQTITFTITVSNNGPGSAANTVLADPTPAGLTFVSNSGACTTAFPCNLGTLTSGQSVTVNSKYTVNGQASARVTNTATVSTSSSDPFSGNDTSSVTLTIVTCPATPPIPTAPTAGTTVASPVTFTWNPVANATSYAVTITGGPAPVTIGAIGTSATANLPAGSYSWTVTAFGGNGCQGMTSAGTPFVVCLTPPAPLASVIGESTTGQTFSVQWNALDGVTSYELQESPNSAFTSPASFTVTGTSKSFLKNVQTPTPFFYRVRGASSCGQGAEFSPIISVVVVPLPDPNGFEHNVNVPVGSTQPVTFQVFVPGLSTGSTSFVATVDKPWLAVIPTSGIVPPEGILLTIAADPSTLPNGTWTGTVIVVYGSVGVTDRIGADGSSSTSIPVSISVVTPVAPSPLTGPGKNALVIPSVGHLAGVNASWRSDIRVANVGANAQKYQLTFNNGSGDPKAGVKQTTINVDPGSTTALDDIVRNWFGIGSLGDSSNGTLTIQPLDANGKISPNDVSVATTLVASSRTYNASSAGTLGQFVPAVAFGKFVGAATKPGILALQQIEQSAAFRTNLGLVESSGKPASVLVSIFDGSGAKLLDVPVSLKGGEQKQLNSFLAANNISLTNGHLEVKVVSGDGLVTSYASVLDSTSGDPFLVQAVPLTGAGAQRFVVTGVADLNTNGASWRSDLRIFNSGSQPQTTTLTFFPSGSNSSAGIAKSMTVNPGEVKAVNNVLQSLFGVSNAGGAVHVTTATDAPLIVTARTFDQTTSGTLGQFIPAVTQNDAVGTGDRSLHILQVEQSVRYRVNLGLAEVTGKPVTAEVTVFLPDSKVAPKVQIPLGPFESQQIPILSSLGLGATYNGRIAVRVIDGDGKLTAYGSIVDMQTDAPTYVPAQ